MKKWLSVLLLNRKYSHWLTYFVVETVFDFAIIFSIELINILMGREPYFKGSYNVENIVLSIVGIRLVFGVIATYIPSLKIIKATWKEKFLFVLILILTSTFISNINNFWHHLNYYYAFNNKMLMGAVQLVIVRSIFDILPRLFRSSSDDWYKMTWIISYIVALGCIYSLLGNSIFQLLLLVFNVDKYLDKLLAF